MPSPRWELSVRVPVAAAATKSPHLVTPKSPSLISDGTTPTRAVENKDVRRLHVAVYELSLMEVYEGVSNGPAEREGLPGNENPRCVSPAEIADRAQELVLLHGKPGAVRVDNGPELTAEAFAEWCRAQEIEIRYIQPGKPDQNAYIERFNRSYRQDVLDAYVFNSLEEVRAVTEEWLKDYNTERPHDSLGRVPPLTFLPRQTSIREYAFNLST